MADVRDFGAVGDGGADDTQAIQHAIDERAGWLTFPPGTYRVTRPIIVDLSRIGPLGLDGSGNTARIIMAGPGPALRIVGSHRGTADPESVTPSVRDTERVPTISQIEIRGEHTEADGIELDGTHQATLIGVSIRLCRTGVRLARRNRNVLISACHIYEGRGPAIGIHFDGVNLHQAIIAGSHISYQKHAGIKVERSEVRNLQITGCDIEYNHDVERPDSADVWIDAREGTIREGTICSNTIQALESPRGANVRIEGPPDPASKGAGLWTIAGNILQSQAVNLLLRNCRGVAVSGNSFASAFECSLRIEGCRHISVGSCTFDHNPDYSGDRVDGIVVRDSAGISLTGLLLESSCAGTPDEGGAIEVVDSSEVSIVGCQVLDPVHRGIDLIRVRNSRVADGTILDRREPPTMPAAIRVREAGRDLILANNLFGRGTRGAIESESRSITMSGNVEIGEASVDRDGVLREDGER